MCGRCGELGHRKTYCNNPEKTLDVLSCNRCLVTKPVDRFYRHKGKIRRFCIDCHAADMKSRFLRDPVTARRKAADRVAQWRAMDIEKYRASDREAARARRARAKASGKSLQYGKWRKDITEKAVIYFIRVGDVGPIKIGWAKHGARSRLLELQISHYEELKVFATIECDSVLDETRIHDKFRGLRIRGEWFEPAPELLDYIAQHARPADGR